MEKLPVPEIVLNALQAPLKDFDGFSKTLLLPSFLLLFLMFGWRDLDSTESSLMWSFYLITLVSFLFFAISCHRFILSDIPRINFLSATELYLFLKFGLFFVVLYVIGKVVFVYLSFFLLINLMPVERYELLADVIQEIIYFPWIYLVARLSMVFPATSIGRKTSFNWSWKMTSNNGLNLFFIVCLFPWALEYLLALIWREEATVIEQAALSLAWVYILAAGIFALSLSYQKLVTNTR